MIRVTAQGNGRPGTRFVKQRADGAFVFCVRDLDRPRIDFQQGTCDGSDLPAEIRAKCEADRGGAFYACEWPAV